MEPRNHQLSYFDLLLAHPLRERLLLECPALLLFLYQHIVASRCADVPIVDPFTRSTRYAPDAVSELLQLQSNDHIISRAFAAPDDERTGRAIDEEGGDARDGNEKGDTSAFWHALQRALSAAWCPAVDDSEEYQEAVRYLCSVDGTVHFLFPPTTSANGGQPLQLTSLQNTLNVSKDFLRTATTCALAGSAASVMSNRRFQALISIMTYERLLPSTSTTGSMASSSPTGSPTASKSSRKPGSPSSSSPVVADADSGTAHLVTSEGINFCMLSLQQQWWVLLNGALDRVLVTTHNAARTPSAATEVTKPHLWQLLAILVMLDGTRLMFAFPDEADDFVGYHLLMRLGEIGLLYGIRTASGNKAFVVSPHLPHALEWLTTAPCCLTSMTDIMTSGETETALRREDTDTIITETNFRLYAYTQSEDLLNIIDMFADRDRIQTASGEADERVSDVLAVYTVTRESFMRAIRKGITAAQVLRFLSLKAHPSMLRHYGEDLHASASGAADGNAAAGEGAASAGSRYISGQTLAVPQSFCDRLLMWENECHRVTFQQHVVLLKNIAPEQAEWLAQYLEDAGEGDAIVHTAVGYMVIQEDVYDRYIAGAVEEMTSPT